MRILKNATIPWLATAVLVSASACSDDETNGTGGSGGTSSSSGSSSSSSSGAGASTASSSSSSSTGATGGEGVGGAGGVGGDGGEGGGVAGAGGAGGGVGGLGGAGGVGGLGGAGGVGGIGGGGGAGGAANVVINEVASTGNDPDWIEFYNAGDATADLTGWYFTDNDPMAAGHTFTFVANTMLAPGGYLVMEKDAAGSFTFGLGDPDAVHLYDAQGVSIDDTNWLTPVNSWARLPNGTGNFVNDVSPTKGAANN